MFAKSLAREVLKCHVSVKSSQTSNYDATNNQMSATTADILQITQLKLMAGCRIDNRK